MPIVGVPNVPTITIAGNQRLNPESLTSFEVGYFGAWGPVEDAESGTVLKDGLLGKGHQFEAGVSVFYNLVDDLVGFESDPNNPLRVMPVNQDNEEVYGIELEGRYLLGESISAFANYSYSVRQNRDTGERSRVTPRNTLNGGVAYTGKNFNATLWANFRDATELDDFAIDSYVLVNGSVSYEFLVEGGTKGQAFVRFFNLLNDKHREHPQGDEYGLIMTAGLQFDW
jgi:outer membrane receptor protein involved in Fe transport